MRTNDRQGRPLALTTVFSLQRHRLELRLETSVRRIQAARATVRTSDSYDVIVRGVHGGQGGQPRPVTLRAPGANPLVW